MHKQMAAAAVVLFFIVPQAKAQQSIEKLIAAEKNFAAAAIRTDTREAFMAFMDSAEAVVFDNSQIVHAFAKWNKAAADTNKLIWQPAYAGIAQSGELGFTTGPWQYKNNIQGTALATGSFATIWHLDNNGTWKFLVDIGTDGPTEQPYTVDSVKKWVGTTIDDLNTKDALTIDRIFVQQYAALKNDAYKAVVTENTWLNLQGQTPVTGTQNILTALNQLLPGLDFNPIGGGISASSDLAYVFGTVRHDAKMGNYLRVWQKTGDRYTLLLQTLHY